MRFLNFLFGGEATPAIRGEATPDIRGDGVEYIKAFNPFI